MGFRTKGAVSIWKQVFPGIGIPITVKTANISRTLVCDEIVDNSDVVGAPPVGAAPTTSSFNFTPGFNTLSEDNCKGDKKHFSYGIWCDLY